MKGMKALRLPKEFGDLVITELRKGGWLDTTRNIIRHQDTIELPVTDTLSYDQLLKTLPRNLEVNLAIVSQSEPSFKNGQKTPFDEVKERIVARLGLANDQLELLPNKWELLGEVLILKLDNRLRKYWPDIAGVYGEVLGARTVLRRVDKIRGIYREPGVELLSGSSTSTETMHIENKVKFKFDPLKIMFSSGNIDERIRISTVAEPQETVVDMFAGIGYLCLPIAVHSKPARIIACELNPNAFKYLTENIKLNQVEDIMQPILGDNRECIPNQIADRVVMGYIKTESSHRIAALKILRPTGGVIHFHDVGFNKEAIESAWEKVLVTLTESGFDKKFRAELLNHYTIKSYGPKLVHVVLDIRLQPN
ncbi:class I SAM-dependent methyltransferase [[Eubacterium] cellulosolvens]